LSYPWSGFGAYLAAPEHRPQWVRVDRLLGEHGIQEDSATGRQRFEARMERRRAEETDPAVLGAMQRGWCLGSEGDKRQMHLGTSKGANRNLHNHGGRGSRPATGQAPPPTKGNPGSTK